MPPMRYDKTRGGLVSYISNDLKHRSKEPKNVKRDQQDATIRCLLSTSVSICCRHHYAHLQENNDRVSLHMVYCAGSAGCGW